MELVSDMFYNRLLKVNKHRSKLARRQQIFCYCLYDQDLTKFPLCIDCMGTAYMWQNMQKAFCWRI